jgi:S-adenosylmethionine hydrolase
VIRRRIITLTTDFGLADGYVAAMKGVILDLAPEATIVDVTHEVPPQSIAAAAFLLAGVVPYFPTGTIHLAVVDPGVGTSRRGIAVKFPGGYLVGPDNGLFTSVLDAQQDDAGTDEAAVAVSLSRPEYRLPDVSNTFHGRDVFAPAAAHLAQGVQIDDLGERVTGLVTLPARRPEGDGELIVGEIVYIDHFGNAISNIPASDLPALPVFEVAGVTIGTLSTTYDDAQVAAVAGSTGLIEFAVRNGNAASELALSVGERVTVRRAR